MSTQPSFSVGPPGPVPAGRPARTPAGLVRLLKLAGPCMSLPPASVYVAGLPRTEARMEIDRRQVLLGTVCSALTGAVGARGTGQDPVELPPGAEKWHPLTRSLLERARRIGRGRSAPDRTIVERTIRQFADGAGWPKTRVIQW